MTVELDFTSDSWDGIESGSRVPEGWYRCVVADTFDDPKNEGAIVLRYQVAAGPWRGCSIEEKLFSPELSFDADKARIAATKLKMRAKRLGLIRPEDMGKRVAIEWPNAIGRECWLCVHARQYEGKDKQMHTATEPKFDGVYALDDERVPVEVRTGKPAPANGAGPAAAAAKPAKAPAKRPAPDYSDL
jgi:hypothetical protein